MVQADPDKVHQIVLRINGSETTVSCNCRAVLGSHDRRGGDYHKPIERMRDETVFDAYNKAHNHWAPFTERDKIRL